MGAHGNRSWKEKRKRLSPRNGFADDCSALLAPQRSWLKLCTASCPQDLLTSATAEYGGPTAYPRLLCPFFLPSCLGGLCPHHLSRYSPGQQRHHQLPQPPCVSRLAPCTTSGSCPSLLGASRALSRQVPLPWGFPQPHRGCPCVPSVTHSAAMLGGAVTSRHGYTGLGTLPRCPVCFNMALPHMAWLGTAWPSISDRSWPGTSSSAQPHPRKAPCCPSFCARAEKGDPKRHHQAWSSVSFPGDCLQLGRLCPCRLTAAAGIESASQGTCFLPHPTLPQG